MEIEDRDSKLSAEFTGLGSIYGTKVNASVVNATNIGYNLTDFRVEFRFTAITDEVSLTCGGSTTYLLTIRIKSTIKVPVFSKLVFVCEIDIKACNNSCRQPVYI